MEHWFLNLKFYVFSRKRKEIALLEDKERTKSPAPQLCTAVHCSQLKSEPSALQHARVHALWGDWRKPRSTGVLHLISFLSLSGSKPNYILKIWCWSTQPKMCILEGEMKELTSKDTREVLRCRLRELWLWPFHVTLRWLPVHSIMSSTSAACWLVPIGKYCTPEPVSSSGSPWGYSGMELSHEHMCLALHLLLAQISGSPLEWPLDRSLVINSVTGNAWN